MPIFNPVPLPVALGGTGSTAPSFTAGTNTTVSGTFPTQAVNLVASPNITALTMAGALTGVTSAGFSSTITSTFDGKVFDSTGSSTGFNYLRFSNTGNTTLIGVESSAGANLLLGSTAYSTVLGTSSARSLQLGTNNNVRFTINSTGDTTLTGALTAGSLITGTSLLVTAVAATAGAGQIAYGSTTATTATTGASGAVPAQVVGYIICNVAGTARKIPYYAT